MTKGTVASAPEAVATRPAAAPDPSRPRISRRQTIGEKNHQREGMSYYWSVGSADLARLLHSTRCRSGSPHPPGRKHPPPGRTRRACRLDTAASSIRHESTSSPARALRIASSSPGRITLNSTSDPCIRSVAPEAPRRGTLWGPRKTCSSVLNSSIRGPPNANNCAGGQYHPWLSRHKGAVSLSGRTRPFCGTAR